MLRFLLLLLLGCVMQPTLASPEEAFNAWASVYHRNYTSEAARALRLKVFAGNLDRMVQLQQLSPQALYAPDEYFDWTDQEKEGLTGLDLTKQRARDDQITFSDETVRNAKAAGDLDWVAKGAVTSPSSQGRCATCQDYSAAADIEGAWATSGHPLTKLSEQEMIDCGGGPGYGMDWVAGVDTGPHADPRGRGLATIQVAPDANHSDPNITGCRHVTNCTEVAQAKKIEGHSVHIDGVACFSHNESQILAGLQYGPMSVSIAAGYFGGYKNGIINCSASGIDHAVLLVGYGTDNSTEAHQKWGGATKYWKLKNSWGPSFGEGGYFRFKFGNVCMRGACKSYIGKPPSP